MIIFNSYAEFQTDHYIYEHFFKDKEDGVMVEVGAGLPDTISMSRGFKQIGWRCICVDPNPYYVEMHKAANNEIYQYALSSEPANDVDFDIYRDPFEDQRLGGLSYSSIVGKTPELNPGWFTIEHIKVNVITLDMLLQQLNINHVDFVSIDVERWELEVLSGFNTNLYEPKVVLIENLDQSPYHVELMAARGYSLEKNFEYNYIFVKN